MESDSMPNETAQRILELMRDPALCELRRAVEERPITWPEFAALPMPAATTPEQAWGIVNALRRQTATKLPFEDGDGRIGWYYPTRSIRESFNEIDRACRDGSWLDASLDVRNATYFLVEEHVDEAVTSLRSDGLSIGYEAARAILLEERGPESSEEQVLCNFQRAFWDIDERTGEPCTPSTILEVHRALTEHADIARGSRPARRPSVWNKKHLDESEALALISDLVNSCQEQASEHPLLLGMAVRYIFANTLPLPSLNNTTSSIMMKLLFKKAHLPVLAFVPLSKTIQEWKHGLLGEPDVSTSYADAEILLEGEIDYTIYVDTVARLTERKVAEMEHDLKRAIERDDKLVRALRGNAEINHRQRSILRVALENPSTVFRIRAHQRAHRIAYATARADLVKLCDLGFLSCERTAQAFEFAAMPGLRRIILNAAQEGSEQA